MPLPLIPLILGGASIAAAAHGVKKGADGKRDMDLAKSINNDAQKICKEADESIKKRKEETTAAIEDLGKKKITILSTSINDFVTGFEKIKNIDFQESEGLDELTRFNPQSPEFLQLKKVAMEAKNVAVNGVGALGGGALLAFGTYNVVMGGLGGLLVTATTGTALSSLTGVAATNATLAWLGGGALSVGGLGMAGGMAVLGGIVAGPALALGGSLFAKQADKAYWNAKSNLQEAKKYQEQANGIIAALKAIESRADQINSLFGKLNGPFRTLIAQMNETIDASGTDWNSYSSIDKKQIYKCAQVATAIKGLLDTALLHEDGTLNEDSGKAVSSSKDFLSKLSV